MKKFYKFVSYLFLSAFFISPVPQCAEKVSFQTADGFRIAGDFYKPAASKKTIVLLHGVGSTKDEWEPFARYLNLNGWGVLIYDARGHAESSQKISGDKVSYEYFFGSGLKSDWGRMIGDLGLAVQYLKEKKKIGSKSIAVGGASIGANVAFRYAAENRDVPFTILLSPGIDYQGITMEDLVPGYGVRPLLMAVSPQDRYSYQSVVLLQKLFGKNPALSIIVETQNEGHGVQMFKRSDPAKASGLEERIFRWIQNQK